jgi:hypothetical protein
MLAHEAIKNGRSNVAKRRILFLVEFGICYYF